MKRLSINKKIFLAYNYTKLKFPHIHLWSFEKYKLLTIRIPGIHTTTKKYLVAPLFKATAKEFEEYVLRHLYEYEPLLSNTPDEAIKYTFPEIPSYEEMQLFLEITGN